MECIVGSEGLRAERKPGMFGNPVTAVTIYPDRLTLERKKTPEPETIPYDDIVLISLGSTYGDTNMNFGSIIHRTDGSTVDVTLDNTRHDDRNNCIETLTLHTAWFQHAVDDGFPGNLRELSMLLHGPKCIAKKRARIEGGQFVFADDKREDFSDLESATLVWSGTATTKLVFKDGYKFSLFSEIANTCIVSAVMHANNGGDIDFSKGNGFDQKDSLVMRARLIAPCVDAMIRGRG